MIERAATRTRLSMGDFRAVLIVDDEPVILAVAGLALAPLFRSVLTAASASLAQTAWSAHEGQFDLLVTDINMPGASGFELADALRAVSPALKILFVSGAPDPEELRRRLVPGECAYLAKPFSVAGLASAVLVLMGPSPAL